MVMRKIDNDKFLRRLSNFSHLVVSERARLACSFFFDYLFQPSFPPKTEAGSIAPKMGRTITDYASKKDSIPYVTHFTSGLQSYLFQSFVHSEPVAAIFFHLRHEI